MRDKTKKSKPRNLFTGTPLINNNKQTDRIHVMIIDMTLASGFTFDHEK